MLVEEAIINDLAHIPPTSCKQCVWQKPITKRCSLRLRKMAFVTVPTSTCGTQFQEQLETAAILDQYVIEKMIEKLTAQEVTSPPQSRASPSSIFNHKLIRWIGAGPLAGKTLQSLTCCISVIPENVSSTFRTTMQHHCNTIRNAEAVFGVDNYGRNFQSLDYINEYRPSYVKITCSRITWTTRSRNSRSRRFHERLITLVCHFTIASSNRWTWWPVIILSDNYVEVFQGFIVDK